MDSLLFEKLFTVFDLCCLMTPDDGRLHDLQYDLEGYLKIKLIFFIEPLASDRENDLVMTLKVFKGHFF